MHTLLCTCTTFAFTENKARIKKMSQTAAHRHGMVFVDDDHGEYEGQRHSSGSDESFHSEGEDIAEYWDPYLYQLQLTAPTPKCIPCHRELPDRPTFYGLEYHGSITRDETARLLGTQEGNYLVRRGLSHSGTYSLSFVFGGQVRHYRLYYDGHDHFVGEKPFETIEDLVQDGLITLYMEANHVEDYLKSARDSRSLRRVVGVGQDTSASNEAVFSEESIGGDVPPPVPSRGVSQRKLPYQPCTFPHRKDTINVPAAPSHAHELHRIYEEVRDDDLPPPVPNGLERPLMPNILKPPMNPDSPKKGRHDSSLYFHYLKPHNFKLLSNMGMSWCDYCRNFMWGLRNQGYRCKDCGYNAHKQCKDDADSDCHPSRQLIKRVYGVELTTLVKLHGTKVPVVVKDCIEEIETRGLDVEGLYRVSGKANDILRIKKQFDNETCADLSPGSNIDIHAITGAMKLYFRELPIPLMTFDSYDICLIAAKSNSVAESLEMLKVALGRLPLAHYNTLRHLIRHLHRVQQQQALNRMDAKNLALVFMPTVMRSPYNTSGALAVQKLPQQKKAMEMLITYYHTLF